MNWRQANRRATLTCSGKPCFHFSFIFRAWLSQVYYDFEFLPLATQILILQSCLALGAIVLSSAFASTSDAVTLGRQKIKPWCQIWPFQKSKELCAPPPHLSLALASAFANHLQVVSPKPAEARVAVAEALRVLTAKPAAWLLEELRVKPALLDDLEPLLRKLRPTLSKGSPVDAYSALLSLQQGQTELKVFCSTFQEAVNKVQLPENARIALLRAALDTTGANLPVWQESPTTLEAAIAALKSYGAPAASHQAREPPTLAALTVVTRGARRQEAPLTSAQDTPVTRYNLV